MTEIHTTTNQKNALTKKIGMFLQDPSLDKLTGNYKFPLEKDYLSLTGSSRFVVRDTNEYGYPIFPGLNWSKELDLSIERFKKEGLSDNPQFHQVNVFAVVNSALDLIEEEIGHGFNWKDGAPLVIRPHAFRGMNAYYDPISPSLNFGYFDSPFRRTPVWTCLSHDIVAHELGHAIFDSFRPLYVYSPDKDTPALHESFADLLSMFSALQYPSVIEHLYRETGGDMRHPSLITRLGEEFGIGIFGVGIPYIRSALEGASYNNAPKQAHARSKVWTAAIYEIMERMVKLNHPDGFPDTFDGFAEFVAALLQATRWIKGMVLRALHYTPPNSLSMPMMVRLIYEADAQVYKYDSKLRDIAKEVFQKRELWNERLSLKAPDIGYAFQDLEHASQQTLSFVIMKYAEELRIPPGALRVINPRLITTNRRIDKVKSGSSLEVKTITEHYLEYTYEVTQLVRDWYTGEMVPFTVYGGSTLVMDQNWNAFLLATSPEIYEDDPSGYEGTLKALKRARDKFDRVHKDSIQKTLAARDENRSITDSPVVPGCPFIIQRQSTGAYRLVHRRSNFQEHINEIYCTKHGLAQL
ncbi:MAG: hypothetical protein QNJ49_15295 [Mastigocoleus sp. MO_167.B18]|nr:hypothetical protein [Mastigocoleus sp. MO_167.B18]